MNERVREVIGAVILIVVVPALLIWFLGSLTLEDRQHLAKQWQSWATNCESTPDTNCP